MYKQCGPGCERTCEQELSGEAGFCAAVCVPGCFCVDGFTLKAAPASATAVKECVPTADCAKCK